MAPTPSPLRSPWAAHYPDTRFPTRDPASRSPPLPRSPILVHGDGHHHHHSGDRPVLYAFPVPYAVDLASTEDQAEDKSDAADDRDPNYQDGPTIFDRRGSGADSYVAPEKLISAHRSAEYTQADLPAPEPAREPTVLVFKDGHQLEVGNYAIVGTTLFDLSPGHSRKVLLADLDLEATQRQNDDRGITFQIPQLVQAN